MDKVLKINYRLLLIRKFHLKSCSRSAKQTHYDLLNVEQACSRKDIRKAFIELSKKLHPDANQGDHTEFIKLNEAYQILNDVKTRHTYDTTLAASHAPLDGTAQFGGNPSQSGSRVKYTTGFHDDAIFSMRDKSKDHNAFYAKDSYYGVKGVKRVSNLKISLISLVIIFCGFLLFLMALSVSNDRIKYDKCRQMVYIQDLTDSRQRAKDNGNEKQLEILAKEIKKYNE